MLKNIFKRSKYKNVKTEVDGIVFASKKEAERYKVLKEREGLGIIKNLKSQVRYEVIPKQEYEIEYWDDNNNISKSKKQHLRATYYIADFVYEDEDGNVIVEDVKGMKHSVGRDKTFEIKRKLMLLFHDTLIKIVTDPND